MENQENQKQAHEANADKGRALLGWKNYYVVSMGITGMIYTCTYSGNVIQHQTIALGLGLVTGRDPKAIQTNESVSLPETLRFGQVSFIIIAGNESNP